MTTITNNKLTDEEITALALKLFDGSSFYFQSGRRPGAKTMAELLNKAASAVAELQERRRTDNQEPAPVDNEFIPKNLDKALGVVGVALPESKEEFNFQTERWIQRLIDRVIRYANEFKEQPVPVVPDEWTIQDAVKFCRETGRQDAGSAMDAWNACRSAMLNGGKS